MRHTACTLMTVTKQMAPYRQGQGLQAEIQYISGICCSTAVTA